MSIFDLFKKKDIPKPATETTTPIDTYQSSIKAGMMYPSGQTITLNNYISGSYYTTNNDVSSSFTFLQALRELSERLNCKIYRFQPSTSSYPIESMKWLFETELGLIEVTGQDILYNNGQLFSGCVDVFSNMADKILEILYNKILTLKRQKGMLVDDLINQSPVNKLNNKSVICYHCGRSYYISSEQHCCPGCGSTEISHE